jgi:hypothetical protein
MELFPHDGHTGSVFYSLAGDNVFVGDKLPAGAVRIMDRLDARNFDLDCYMFELRFGSGRIVAATLRFGGGSGDQATDLNCSPAAIYWLSRIVEYLGCNE